MTEYTKPMKIYSWNVYCYNPRIKELAEAIRTLDFDVLCLQEVTDELLEILQEMPFHLVSHVDVIRLVKKERRERNYVVILSRKPFVNSGTLQFFNFPFQFHIHEFLRWS